MILAVAPPRDCCARVVLARRGPCGSCHARAAARARGSPPSMRAPAGAPAPGSPTRERQGSSSPCGSDARRTPASVQKLLTTATALERLGADARTSTTVRRVRAARRGRRPRRQPLPRGLRRPVLRRHAGSPGSLAGPRRRRPAASKAASTATRASSTRGAGLPACGFQAVLPTSGPLSALSFNDGHACGASAAASSPIRPGSSRSASAPRSTRAESRWSARPRAGTTRRRARASSPPCAPRGSRRWCAARTRSPTTTSRRRC